MLWHRNVLLVFFGSGRSTSGNSATSAPLPCAPSAMWRPYLDYMIALLISKEVVEELHPRLPAAAAGGDAGQGKAGPCSIGRGGRQRGEPASKHASALPDDLQPGFSGGVPLLPRPDACVGIPVQSGGGGGGGKQAPGHQPCDARVSQRHDFGCSVLDRVPTEGSLPLCKALVHKSRRAVLRVPNRCASSFDAENHPEGLCRHLLDTMPLHGPRPSSVMPPPG